MNPSLNSTGEKVPRTVETHEQASAVCAGLSMRQLRRAAELLDVIVRPGDNDFGPAIEEAQKLLGYEFVFVKVRKKRRRTFYGIRKPNNSPVAS